MVRSGLRGLLIAAAEWIILKWSNQNRTFDVLGKPEMLIWVNSGVATEGHPYKHGTKN